MVSNRETELHWDDHFNREDNSSVGNGWDETIGDMTISQEAVRQGASAVVQGKIQRAVPTSIGDDYEITASFATVDDASKTDQAALVLFRRTPDSESPSIAQGYSAGIGFADGVATLYIRKRNDSSENVASVVVTTDMNTVSSSYLSVFQTMRVRVWNTDEYVHIEVYLNDADRPALSYDDYKFPQWRRANNFGFAFSEGASGENNIVLNHISIDALRRAQDEDAGPPVASWNFSKLRKHARTLALRDSGSLVDDDFWGDLVNEALQEVSAYVGRAYWWEDLYRWTWASGKTETELPADTAYLDDVIWDIGSGTQYNLFPEESFRRSTATNSSGTATVFRWAASGPGGGPVIRAWQTPAADTTYEVRRFRTPRVMVNPSDIPDLPQEFAAALAWGAVAMYSFRDSDRTHIRAASARWESWLRKIRREAQRRMTMANQPLPMSGLKRPSLYTYNERATAKFGIRKT